MGRIIDRVTKWVETCSGPLDWQCERIDSSIFYSGCFLVFDRHGSIRSRVPGRIAQRRAQAAEVYLYDPPRFIRKHRHGRCMQLLTPNDRWFKLHFDKPASDFAEAYTYVEHLLTEAYNLAS